MQNIVVVGDSGVGKTSFVRQLLGHAFTETYMATIGKEMHIYDNLIIQDTAGQKRFSRACEEYYKYAHGAVVFYEVDSNDSVPKWIDALQQENENIPIVIVCNKIDLNTSKDTWEFPHVYISCKTGENVAKVMEILEPDLLKISPPETWYEYCQRFDLCLVQ
jgi:small GTP-binding protein